MANVEAQRIKQDFQEVIKNEEIAKLGIQVKLVNDNFTELKVEITGPPNTPYEGGNFVLEIKVPKTYPCNPPKMRFITKIWHPNISSVTGAICLYTLNGQWEHTTRLQTILLLLHELLSATKPRYDPQDPVVAKQFRGNRAMFESTARHWTNAYAGGPYVNTEFDGKIRKLVAMGVFEYEARLALSSYNWDLKLAIERLFN